MSRLVSAGAHSKAGGGAEQHSHQGGQQRCVNAGDQGIPASAAWPPQRAPASNPPSPARTHHAAKRQMAEAGQNGSQDRERCAAWEDCRCSGLLSVREGLFCRWRAHRSAERARSWLTGWLQLRPLRFWCRHPTRPWARPAYSLHLCHHEELVMNITGLNPQEVTTSRPQCSKGCAHHAPFWP